MSTLFHLLFNFTSYQLGFRSHCFLFEGNEYEFTPKEIDIIKVLKYTSIAKEITDHLNKNNLNNISIRTVEWHLTNIKKKSKLSNSLDLRNFAIEITKHI